jgi:hypothetical protein
MEVALCLRRDPRRIQMLFNDLFMVIMSMSGVYLRYLFFQATSYLCSLRGFLDMSESFTVSIRMMP